ncbi:MAG: lactate utilization protein [Proteobacteria bacterium]|nr:lactate utilization protein [Pseudomonadota bacterium]MBU1451077.1 lactate utilization protein [Pseudomonadota bacterium]MBU2467789.1 lactate utilization protein [Pseudomonadota bacterium]MBU2517811.1 lactate utilization protein [Pseudomonadota bacterium]
MSQPQLRQEFSRRAEAVSAVVKTVESLEDAFAQAARLTREQGGACLAAPGWEPGELAALQAACEREGLELITQGLRERAGQFHTGLTRAQWGVAETGTIVVDSASEDLRLATMLAEMHVAVLPAANLRADLFALEDEVNRTLGRAPGYLAFISGPSRTGDIELVLTLGAHGPRQLHILLLEESS